MLRAVVDTNVIVSSLISPHSTNAELIANLYRGAFELLISNQVVAEYEDVLRRPRIQRFHKKSNEEIDRFLRTLALFAEVVEPARSIGVTLADADDMVFLECAIGGNADVIVSGDKHLLALGAYGDIRIVTPAEFIDLLDRAPNEAS